MPTYNQRTHEEFVKLIEEKYPGKFEILGTYINAQIKIKVRCKIDNCIWYPIANNLLRGKGCPKCFGNLPYTSDTFKEKVFEMYSGEYEVLGEYIDSQTPIQIRHIPCDHKYFVKPYNFTTGRKCPNCKNERLSKSNRKSQEQFEKEIFDLTSGEYVVIGQYSGKKKHVKIKHLICNYEYDAAPENFLRGSRCPLCKISKGEMKVREFLEKHNYTFDIEFSFPDLKHDGFLRFDFVVFTDESRSTINSLIEYDGEFHYEEIITKEHLELQQLRDHLKNEYCANNYYNLIRIPYWNFEYIDEILTNELLSRPRNEEEINIWLQSKEGVQLKKD